MAGNTIKHGQRLRLLWAQCCICPDCAEPLDPDAPPLSLEYPTRDHVQPRAAQGPNTINNMLMRHRRCNDRKGARMPTENDYWWLDYVAERFKLMPPSLAERRAQVREMFAQARALAA